MTADLKIKAILTLQTTMVIVSVTVVMLILIVEAYG